MGCAFFARSKLQRVDNSNPMAFATVFRCNGHKAYLSFFRAIKMQPANGNGFVSFIHDHSVMTHLIVFVLFRAQWPLKGFTQNPPAKVIITFELLVGFRSNNAIHDSYTFNSNVTGPSLTSSTCISAAKRPVSTGTP